MLMILWPHGNNSFTVLPFLLGPTDYFNKNGKQQHNTLCILPFYISKKGFIDTDKLIARNS